MTSEDFVAEILASTDDDTPRLIYADWLEERGDPRGEFIRVQCEVNTLTRPPSRWSGMYGMAHLPYTSPDQTVRQATDLVRYRELLAKQLSLLTEHCGDWTKPLGTKLAGAIFARGFVEGCSTTAADYSALAPQWYRITPIHQLYITQMGLDLASLLQSPLLLNVHTMEFQIGGRFYSQEAALIAVCPHVANVRHLSMGYHDIGESGVRALLESPYLSRLQDLVVRSDKLSTSLRSELQARFGQPY